MVGTKQHPRNRTATLCNTAIRASAQRETIHLGKTQRKPKPTNIRGTELANLRRGRVSQPVLKKQLLLLTLRTKGIDSVTGGVGLRNGNNFNPCAYPKFAANGPHCTVIAGGENTFIIGSHCRYPASRSWQAVSDQHWSWGRGGERAAPVGQAYNSAFASPLQALPCYAASIAAMPESVDGAHLKCARHCLWGFKSPSRHQFVL